MLAAVYWARAPRVVLPDRALCLPTFCHSLLTVNKSSSSSLSGQSNEGTRDLHAASSLLFHCIRLHATHMHRLAPPFPYTLEPVLVAHCRTRTRHAC